MTRQSRWGLVSSLLAALLLGAAGGADAHMRLRWWHGTLIENLQAPAARASVAAERRRFGPAYGVPTDQTRVARLSNERTLTRWANAAYRGPVYAHPVR